MGRHLIGLGLAPGKSFGQILELAYEAQLEGVIEDELGAFQWLSRQEQFKFPDAVVSELADRCVSM